MFKEDPIYVLNEVSPSNTSSAQFYEHKLVERCWFWFSVVQPNQSNVALIFKLESLALIHENTETFIIIRETIINVLLTMHIKNTASVSSVCSVPPTARPATMAAWLVFFVEVWFISTPPTNVINLCIILYSFKSPHGPSLSRRISYCLQSWAWRWWSLGSAFRAGRRPIYCDLITQPSNCCGLRSRPSSPNPAPPLPLVLVLQLWPVPGYCPNDSL